MAVRAMIFDLNTPQVANNINLIKSLPLMDDLSGKTSRLVGLELRQFLHVWADDIWDLRLGRWIVKHLRQLQRNIHRIVIVIENDNDPLANYGIPGSVADNYAVEIIPLTREVLESPHEDA